MGQPAEQQPATADSGMGHAGRHDAGARHPRRPRGHMAPVPLDGHRRAEARRRHRSSPPPGAGDPHHPRWTAPRPAGARHARPGSVRPDDRCPRRSTGRLAPRAGARPRARRLGVELRRRRGGPRPGLASAELGSTSRRGPVCTGRQRSRRRRGDVDLPFSAACGAPGGADPRPLVGGAAARTLDRRDLPRHRPRAAAPQATASRVGGALLARRPRPLPRHPGAVAHPSSPGGPRPGPPGALRAAACRAQPVG